jgi:hypothetical protein
LVTEFCEISAKLFAVVVLEERNELRLPSLLAALLSMPKRPPELLLFWIAV